MIPICRTEKQRTLFWKSFDRRRWQFLNKYEAMTRRALITQVKPVLNSLKEGMSQGLAAVELIDNDPILRVLEKLYLQVGTYYANDIFEGLKSVGGYQKKSEDDFITEVQAFIQTEGVVIADLIANNTQNSVREIIRRAIEKGDTVEDVARKLETSGRIAGRARARAIARTEIISASNFGSLRGAERSGIPLKKEWISTRDNRTRGSDPKDVFDHIEPDGQTRLLNEPFKVTGEDLMYPGDRRSASAGNTIMCRCTQAYIPI